MHLKTLDLQTPVSPQTFTHIGALDGVRALSILLVLVAHSVPFGPNRWGLNGMSGLMGMALFFCLSGFLIVSLLYRNADALTFLVRRILRIVPAVAVYVVIMVLLFGIGWRAVAENALFVTNYFYDGRGRGEVAAPMTHLWSLSVEMHFYLAIGVAAFVMGRRCVWLIPPAALAITYLRIDQGAYYNIATHLRVDEILSGGILALVTLHYGTSLRRLLSRQSVAIGALLVASVLLVLSCHEVGVALRYTRPYCAAFFVGVLIHCRIEPIHRVLEGDIAAYIARISYALYIYHPLTLWGWMNSGTDIERYLLKRPVSYAMMFAMAHVSTFYWEARWQALARRLTAGRKPT